MKKILSMLSFVLMLVCVGLAFTSCGGDDDDDELDPSNPIVGTWMTEKQAGAYGTVTFRKNGTLSMGVYIPEEMKIDNKFIRESIEKSMPIIEGTYTADGSKINVSITKYCLGEVDLTEYLKIPTQTSTYSISKDNKKLTVKFNEFYSGYAETRVYTRMK
jgi:hypothetical protein